jgi:hypothetical protein
MHAHTKVYALKLEEGAEKKEKSENPISVPCSEPCRIQESRTTK